MKSAEIKATVMRAAGEAGSLTHDGFAHYLGSSFKRSGRDEGRLRTALKGLVAGGFLRHLDHGVWGVARGDLDGACVPPGVAIEVALRQAFRNAGGIMPMSAILEATGGDADPDGATARAVRRALRDSSRYFQGLPLPGKRNYWTLSPAERLMVPLPGRLLLADTQLADCNVPGRDVPTPWQLRDRLAARRREIGAALQAARWSVDRTAEDMIAGAVGVHLDRCLREAPPSVRPGYLAVKSWWRDLVESEGLDVALAEAWRLVEGADEALKLVNVLDVRFWDAVALVTGTDAAAMSRGAVEAYSGGVGVTH